MITDHPPFEQLSELADGELAPDAAAALERHVAQCAICRADLARVRALVRQAAALPESIEPPAQAWAALRGRLRPRARSARGYWVRDWGLRAAAAIVLVAGSSALTVLAIRARTPTPVAVVPGGRAGTPVVPAAVRSVEQSYADVVEELTVTLRAQRPALAPETIATLERTLRIIDQAIAEARAALAADPGNDALREVLSANYEQKVQLLRRASELPART
jgi:anti-sigma factor RsiW